MQTNFRASRLVLLSLVLAAFVVSARPAAAELTLCNRSAESISMALAYRDGAEFVTRGWYNAEPGECPMVVSGALQNRFYYVRAEGSGGGRWEGEYSFCVTDVRFSHRGDDCRGGGLDPRGFFEIDTGMALTWTHSLTGRSETDLNQATHDAIAGLRVSWRPSLLEDGSLVMLLHNDAAITVDVVLTCHTTFGTSGTMVIRVPGYGVGEVGFLQGWPGNFVRGESCEAYHGPRELVWRVTVP